MKLFPLVDNKNSTLILREKIKLANLVSEIPEEILANPNSIYLDPSAEGGKELSFLIKDQRERGFSDDNISGRIFGFFVDQTARDYAINKEKLIGNFAALNFLKLEIRNNSLIFTINGKEYSMRFDVIISNPPYQAPNNKAGKLWVDFLHRSMDLSDRIVLFVAPQLLCNGDTAPIKEIRNKVSPYIVKLDCTADCYFSGVGEKICWYLLDKNSDSEEFTLINNQGTVTRQRKDQSHYYTNEDDSFKRSIFDKFENNKFPKFSFVQDTANSPSQLKNLGIASGEESEEFSFVLRHSASNNLFLRTPMSTYGRLKFVINFSGGYYSEKKPDKYMFATTDCIGKQMYGIEVPSQETADRAKTLLSSKPYRYYVEKSKTGGFNVNLHKLPNLGLDRTWSDSLIYKELGLDEKQIEEIESCYP